MTTHLHPIDGRPLTDTPITDYNKVDYGYMVYFVVAEELEERARTAEAQLAVAVAELERQSANYSDRYNAAEALAEIKAIGGGK